MADSNLIASGLTAAPGVGQIVLNWTVSGETPAGLPYLLLNAVEVWASATNNRGAATKIAETLSAYTHANIGSGVTRYYWIRPRNNGGAYGDWFPLSATAGVSATSGTAQPGPDSITSVELAPGAVDNAALGAQVVQRPNIGLSAVGGNQVGPYELEGVHLKYATIESAHIISLQASKIVATSLSAISANLGTITAGTMSAVTINGGTINSVILNSVTLNSANIVGGSIAGVSITTTDFRSSNAFPRIEMGLSLLLARNLFGANLLSINATGTTRILNVDASIPSDFAAAFRNGSAAAVQGQSPTWAFYASAGAYGPFTASHEILWPRDTPLPEPGDLVMDDVAIFRNGLSNALFRGKPSERGRPAIGVFVCEMPMMVTAAMPQDMSAADIEELAALYRLILVNAVGEGHANVCAEGGIVEAGDLLTPSSTPGKAMRQADDLLRASTVARARESMVSDEAGRAQIAVVYASG